MLPVLSMCPLAMACCLAGAGLGHTARHFQGHTLDGDARRKRKRGGENRQKKGVEKAFMNWKSGAQ